jgi:hypothetical protein
MIDLEREQLRKTYQLSRLGFAILSMALVLACFPSLLHLLFFNHRFVLWVSQSAWFRWLDTPIVWGSLIGTMLLWGRWDQPSWQRRSGLLLAMSLVDLALWFIDQGEALGLRQGDFGHDWLRHNLGQALGWAEFALIASLSGDYLVHLGNDQARDSAISTRSMAATGAVVWMLLFCEQTDWGAGWPLQHLRMRGMESLLLFHGFSLIWAITLIQATAMTISAARQSGVVLAEMDREDQDHDLLRSPSESDKDFDYASTYWEDRDHFG